MKLTPIAEATGNTVPRPLNSQPPAEPVIFTAEEARRGYAMRGNTQHYCCYGMYCEAGHTSDCRFASGVKAPCLTCAANHYCPDHNPAPAGVPASPNDQPKGGA